MNLKSASGNAVNIGSNTGTIIVAGKKYTGKSTINGVATYNPPSKTINNTAYPTMAEANPTPTAAYVANPTATTVATTSQELLLKPTVGSTDLGTVSVGCENCLQELQIIQRRLFPAHLIRVL